MDEEITSQEIKHMIKTLHRMTNKIYNSFCNKCERKNICEVSIVNAVIDKLQESTELLKKLDGFLLAEKIQKKCGKK